MAVESEIGLAIFFVAWQGRDQPRFFIIHAPGLHHHPPPLTPRQRCLVHVLSMQHTPVSLMYSPDPAILCTSQLHSTQCPLYTALAPQHTPTVPVKPVLAAASAGLSATEPQTLHDTPITLQLLRRSAQAAGVQGLVRFQLSDCAAWQPRQQPTLCVVNPPWGSRLLASSSPDSLWESGSAADGQVPQGSQPAPVGEELQAAWQALRAFFKVSLAWDEAPEVWHAHHPCVRWGVHAMGGTAFEARRCCCCWHEKAKCLQSTLVENAR